MKSYILKALAWFKRRWLISKIGLISSVILLVVLFFASAIAKWYINSNGEDLSGRRLHLNSLSINYLTFSVTAEDFVMYEANQKDTFAYVGNLYANMNPWALFGGEYDLSAIEIDRLKLQIIQYDSTFNFSDLQSDEPADTTAEETQYYLNNVKLTNSKITYVDSTLGITYPIHDLNISAPKFAWNEDQSDVSIQFLLGKEGKADIQFGLNNLKSTYTVDLKTENLNLSYGEAYLLDLFNIQSTKGFLNTDLAIDGSLENPMEIFVKGTAAISQLDIIDKRGNPFSKIDSVGVSIDSINLDQYYFAISETTIKRPIAYPTMGKNSTNIDYVLAPVLSSKTPNTSTDKATEEKSFHFSIEKALILDGQIHYTDLTFDRPFKYTISNLNITTKGISETSKNLSSVFSMTTNGKGRITGTSTFDLVVPENIQLAVKIQEVDLLSFSPFSEYYVASPILQGNLNYELGLAMSSTYMENTNQFDIRELEFGKKIRSDSAYKVPVKLALILLKDKNDNIQFEIPIMGDPSDPDFKLMPLVWQTFGKFMIKAASSPMSAISSIAGNNAEDADKLIFSYGQKSLDDKQKNVLDKIAEFHAKKPQLFFSFVQMTNPAEEKLEMAINEAKQRFIPNDWKNVANNDDAFLTFLTEKTGGGSFEQMCVKLIGEGSLESKIIALIAQRNQLVKDYLISKQLAQGAFEIRTADLKNIGEQHKRPQFKIEVSTN